MSRPLVAIGGAVLEVIGLNPQGLSFRSEASWPSQEVFDAPPFYQATGLGERSIKLKLAARPHVMGGLGALATLRMHHEAQDVVPFIRMGGGNVGDVGGDVAIKEIGQEETKIAPDGLGRRHEVDVTLIVVERHGGGLFDAAADFIGSLIG